mgnify:CR=1 FL=1
MNPLLPEQQKQIDSWVSQRDSILLDISIKREESAKLIERNKELASSNTEIADKIQQSEGRLIELSKKEIIELKTKIHEIKDKQMAKVRIHSDVHKKLSLEVNAKVAKPMMAFLAAEIASQILASSLSDWEQSEEAVVKSPLAAFLKRINRIQPCTLNDLKALVKEAGMPKLKAILHADQQSVRSIAEG